MKNKVGIISLGCAKNRVDAEMLIAKLDKSKFELIEDVAMADAAIINTCAFISKDFSITPACIIDNIINIYYTFKSSKLLYNIAQY